eukprot:scaffold437_cov63-Phaeocystis_antarctica.AAC.1
MLAWPRSSANESAVRPPMCIASPGSAWAASKAWTQFDVLEQGRDDCRVTLSPRRGHESCDAVLLCKVRVGCVLEQKPYCLAAADVLLGGGHEGGGTLVAPQINSRATIDQLGH